MALPDDFDATWTAYLSLEQAGLRRPALTELGNVIQKLARAPHEERRQFAFDIARRVVDEGEDIPVRHPLFRLIVGPELTAGLADEVPGCARWLAGFSQQLYRCPDLLEQLGPHASDIALLRLALTQDQTDSASLAELIQREASYLHFTLHELPVGVLYGMDGATVAECTDLLIRLDEFRKLVLRAGVAAEHADIISRCDFHFRAYRDYLLQGNYSGYAHFLRDQELVPPSGA